MKYPITKETILNSMLIVEKTSGEKATQAISDYWQNCGAQHINAAYIQGYSDGVQANVKGSGAEL